MKTITIIALTTLALFSGAITAKPNHSNTRHHPKNNTHQTISTQVNINTASATQLSHLKGIGPKKAEQIVSDRNKNGSFKTLADLSRVKGIGTKNDRTNQKTK